MNHSYYPSLYQVNTRVWLTDLSNKTGKQITLSDIPDAELDLLARYGCDWIWLLSVWQTGEAGQKVSRTHPGWRKEFIETLPDLKEEDISGSGFAITGYHVHEEMGGDQALEQLRERLVKRGLKLMLDFVPNHTGIDHPWARIHPEYYIQGSESDKAREPGNYISLNGNSGSKIMAHGRDPYFPGWPDTLQLNYANPDLQEALVNELKRISGQCDGVRCDMAMLVLPDVFERTWGIRPESFWPRAIRRVHETNPDFCFMAEVYWHLEWTLQQEGFDYTYDKRLYDRLREDKAKPVREHFNAGMDFQSRLTRFLENHDEPRATVTFPPDKHEAAAVITFFSPGLRFFHQGQFEGKTKHISPHLCRAPDEPVNERLQNFYVKLMNLIRISTFRMGNWKLLECLPAWEGNWSNDGYIAFWWNGSGEKRFLVVINYSNYKGQCYVKLPFEELKDAKWLLQDQFRNSSFERHGNELYSQGLFLDEPPWSYYVFLLKKM